MSTLRRVVADNIYSFIFGAVRLFHALRLKQILYIISFQKQSNVGPQEINFLFTYYISYRWKIESRTAFVYISLKKRFKSFSKRYDDDEV